MNKLLRIFITGIFLTGIVASVICLRYSPNIVSGSCHNKAQAAPLGDDSCLSHCLKQKISAVKSESKVSVELRIQEGFFTESLVPINLQNIEIRPGIEKFYYVNQLITKLKAGQVNFTPLFNHSPPHFF